MANKFDDCVDCRFRRKPRVCADCDCGEQFESNEIQEVTFRSDQMFRRAEMPLTTDDDEPNCNPDDLVQRLDEAEECEDSEDE